MNALQMIGICIIAVSVCAAVISYVIGQRARKRLGETLDSEYGPKKK